MPVACGVSRVVARKRLGKRLGKRMGWKPAHGMYGILWHVW
ncbi:MAG TPA: hypothetical protein VID72_11400 [Ktedonobacterales bacterium]